ncbi:shikimate dehydrogenase family protein [Moheibacter sp.]|uniref:shikimate dehydrogenase family protein n=1 Tax=Moheibacter sp. TaxID=1965316 RepID=UPI003C77B408
MRKFGLIGKNIAYSFSESYFHDKFRKENITNSTYQLFDLKSISEVEELFQTKELKGFNVTIPYKEEIIPYLDELSPEAQKIGAVNCVKIQNNKKIGFNTDAFGFENSLKPLLEKHHQKALILGDGGAAKAVKFALTKLDIEFKSVTRKGELKFSDLNQEIISTHQLIINCTPVGTFPDLETSPDIPYEFLTDSHLLYDLIYNPEKTKFLQLGETQGAKIKNGYEMLVLQAEKSWEIWSQSL